MKTAIIALKNVNYIPDIEADYIGADKGALFLLQNNYPITLAVGDFDSVDNQERLDIIQHANEVIVLPEHKDDSDSEHAILIAKERGYDNIILASSINGRADHSIVNLRLIYKYPEITLIDAQNKIKAYRKGTYIINKDDYPYVSLFTFDYAVVSLHNFVYPLENQTLYPLDTYTLSNEIKTTSATIEVKEGTVLLLQTKDAN